MFISSLQNNRVKQAVKLRRRAGRDEQGRFLVDGVREIEQALQSGLPILQGFVCPALDRARRAPGVGEDHCSGGSARSYRCGLGQAGVRAST